MEVRSSKPMKWTRLKIPVQRGLVDGGAAENGGTRLRGHLEIVEFIQDQVGHRACDAHLVGDDGHCASAWQRLAATVRSAPMCMSEPFDGSPRRRITQIAVSGRPRQPLGHRCIGDC